MKTKYTHRVTVAVPESLILEANHLACIMGESAEDINTFNLLSYQDNNGILYAVCSSVVTDNFIETKNNGINSIPEHAKLADPVLALEAFNAINEPNGIKLLIQPNAKTAINEMGLILIPSDFNTN
jgi:hypothetical protein